MPSLTPQRLFKLQQSSGANLTVGFDPKAEVWVPMWASQKWQPGPSNYPSTWDANSLKVQGGRDRWTRSKSAILAAPFFRRGRGPQASFTLVLIVARCPENGRERGKQLPDVAPWEARQYHPIKHGQARVEKRVCTSMFVEVASCQTLPGLSHTNDLQRG